MFVLMVRSYLNFGIFALSFLFVTLGVALLGCQPSISAPNIQSLSGKDSIGIPVGESTVNGPTLDSTTRVTPTLAAQQPATITPLSTSTNSPEPTSLPTLLPTLTATIDPTPTKIAACSTRRSSDDLLVLVTQEYGLGREYVPPNLIQIATQLPLTVTLGYPTALRQVALEPLSNMIGDMLEEGLRPQVISGYRSYSSQAIAWNKWREKNPDTAAIISAPPGHSEHQLGTTVDFGSPELASIVGEEDIEFHTYFYQTSEGKWLQDHAHEYGFTLSYSREAFEITGLYYEPWHFRYIGRELATKLHDNNLTLVEYLLENEPAPCIPD